MKVHKSFPFFLFPLYLDWNAFLKNCPPPVCIPINSIKTFLKKEYPWVNRTPFLIWGRAWFCFISLGPPLKIAIIWMRTIIHSVHKPGYITPPPQDWLLLISTQFSPPHKIIFKNPTAFHIQLPVKICFILQKLWGCTGFKRAALWQSFCPSFFTSWKSYYCTVPFPHAGDHAPKDSNCCLCIKSPQGLRILFLLKNWFCQIRDSFLESVNQIAWWDLIALSDIGLPALQMTWSPKCNLALKQALNKTQNFAQKNRQAAIPRRNTETPASLRSHFIPYKTTSPHFL